MVACAVIIRICGRSVSGVAATSSLIEIEARRVGHQVVDDEHVDAALGQGALRLADAAGLEHVVPFATQRLAQRPPDLLFVVDEQKRAAPRRRMPARSLRLGRSMRISVPSPARLSSAIEPPMPSMMFLAIASPRPEPVRLVVKYGSNTRGRSSGFTPMPRSRMMMRKELGSADRVMRSAMPGALRTMRTATATVARRRRGARSSGCSRAPCEGARRRSRRSRARDPG